MRLSQQILQRDATQSKLPEHSAAKLSAMQEIRVAALAKSRALGDEIRDAIRLRDGVESERVRLVTEFSHQKPNPADIAKIDAAIEAQRAEVRRIQAKADQAKKSATLISEPIRVLQDWIDQNAEADFRPCKSIPKAKKASGESWTDAITRMRSDIGEMKADVHHVQSAPIPAAEAIEAMRAEIEALADAGAPDATACLEGGSIRWATGTMLDGTGAVMTYRALDTRGLMAWLHKDELIHRLATQIEAAADPSQAFTASAREAELNKLGKAILTAERMEEAAIVAAMLEGTAILRRTDADPRAVLELSDDLPGLEDDL